MLIKLDKADHKILQHIQENASLSIEQLAEISGLSKASTQRRLKKLRAAKIIDREITILNPKPLDQKMTFIVMVELERERLDQLDIFRRAAMSEPQVQQCYYITGEADFTLVCITKDMEEFEALTHRLFFNNQNVRRFRTSVVMDRVKVGLSVPVG